MTMREFWEKIKLKTAPKIRAWVERRIDDQQPVTYRLISLLISDYAERYKVPSAWAREHMLECGIKDINPSILGLDYHLSSRQVINNWLRP